MPSIEFGSRKAANDTRDKVEQYLSRTDDRRESTVRLQSSTPDKIVKRVEESAFKSREQQSRGAGKAKLSDKEQKSLKRQHDTFSWQEHGFEAMAVKGAVQAEGVTEWQDFYEPGEGVNSALAKVREKKSQAQQSRAATGIGGKRSDTDEMRNTGRRSKQSERASAQRVKSAKEPAIVSQDAEAIDFLREEQQFGDGDVFDIQVSGKGPTLDASGRDLELLEQRNDARSMKAQRMDDLKAAEITKDPIAWAQNPAGKDFPTIDTLEPEKVHKNRSEKAREVDNNELAPIADTRKEWAGDMDNYDWPDVDTPQDAGDMDMLEDDRALQDTLGFAGDATEARESRKDAEQNTGGLMEDTRSKPGRGVKKNDPDKGEQQGLDQMDEIDAARVGKEVSESMGDVDRDLRDMNL